MYSKWVGHLAQEVESWVGLTYSFDVRHSKSQMKLSSSLSSFSTSKAVYEEVSK